MTATVPTALRELRAARDRALADPAVTTSPSRAERLKKVTSTLERAAADLPPEVLSSAAALLDPKVIGHPDTPDTVLGRTAAGAYRTRPPLGKPLTAASQRDLMDGLADLNRAAGQPPFWWQARGAKPWSRHTLSPLDFTGHVTLRRVFTEPAPDRVRPYLLRALAALEILWDTAVTREGLVAANTTDLDDDLSTIRLTVNPPGRTEARPAVFELSANTRAALRLWLPIRQRTVDEHLRGSPDYASHHALFVTLRHTIGTYPDGSPRMVPPGLRIKGNGLERDYSKWARWANREHEGEPGFPIPTNLYRVARGGRAVN